MENKSLLKLFISNIVISIRGKVNEFALSCLQESGRFDPDEAYYKMQEYGGTLEEYAYNKFFSQLFSPKISI